MHNRNKGLHLSGQATTTPHKMNTPKLTTIKTEAIRLVSEYKQGISMGGYKSMMRKVRILSRATGMPVGQVMVELGNY